MFLFRRSRLYISIILENKAKFIFLVGKQDPIVGKMRVVIIADESFQSWFEFSFITELMRVFAQTSFTLQ